jgi:hypothetical protein
LLNPFEVKEEGTCDDNFMRAPTKAPMILPKNIPTIAQNGGPDGTRINILPLSIVPQSAPIIAPNKPPSRNPAKALLSLVMMDTIIPLDLFMPLYKTFVFGQSTWIGAGFLSRICQMHFIFLI